MGLAAIAILALFRGEDSEDAEVGALLVAELLAHQRAWFRAKQEAARKPATRRR